MKRFTSPANPPVPGLTLFMILILALSFPKAGAAEAPPLPPSQEPPPEGSLQIRLNGYPRLSRRIDNLMEEALPLPDPAEKGIPLADLYPPLKTIWTLQAWNRDGDTRTWTEELSPKKMETLYLTPAGIQSAEGEPFPGVYRIDLQGETLPVQPLEITLPPNRYPRLRRLIDRFSRLREVPVTLTDQPPGQLQQAGGLGRRRQTADLALISPQALPVHALTGEIFPLEVTEGAVQYQLSQDFRIQGRYWAMPLGAAFTVYACRPDTPPPPDLTRPEKLIMKAPWTEWPNLRAFLQRFYPDPPGPGETLFSHPGAPAAFDQLRFYLRRLNYLPIDSPRSADGRIAESQLLTETAGDHPFTHFHPVPPLYGIPWEPPRRTIGLARLSTEKDPALSRALITYLLSPAVQASLAEPGGLYPARSSAAWALPADRRRLYEKLLPLGSTPAVPPEDPEKIRSLQSMLPLFLGGQIDSPAMLKRINQTSREAPKNR